MNNKNKVIPPEVEEYFIQQRKSIVESEDWKNFQKSYESLRNAIDILPFDPKFNAINWAFDVVELISEIAYSYCWMNSYAEYFFEITNPQENPSYLDFNISYFIDNCNTRIYSARDKIALMVYAYYNPFHPDKRDEILDYIKILKKLKNDKTFKNQDAFLKYLNMLDNISFDKISEYRHRKIHRRELRVEMFGVKSFHGWSYMLPITDTQEIKNFKIELKKKYPDQFLYENILKSCYINNVLYDRKNIQNHMYTYKEIKNEIKDCLMKILTATSGCFRVLRRRSPIRKSKI